MWVRFGGLLLVGLFFIPGSAHSDPFSDWLKFERSLSIGKLIHHSSYPGVAPGAVIASPSRKDPDYFYHWVRDAALVQGALVSLYASERSSEVFRILTEGVRFAAEIQGSANRSGGLGEPKFFVDGRPYDGDWGRPQNDGPALRAIAFLPFAQDLATQTEQGLNEARQWLSQLYDFKPGARPRGMIAADLNFIEDHWKEPSFDVWEEVHGFHFYTQMVQKRALLEGASLAQRLGDAASAWRYREVAAALGPKLGEYWDEDKGAILATLGAGPSGKSGVDCSVLLGVLQGNQAEYGFADDRVQATVSRLIDVFQELYPINQRGYPGAAIGRYPEDRYDGALFQGGNPWVLCTLAVGEWAYRMVLEWKSVGVISVSTRALPLFKKFFKGDLRQGDKIERANPRFSELISQALAYGDQYLRRVQIHQNPDGSLSEQMDRTTGFMRSAENLTWNYVAFLSALRQRESALSGL